MRSARLACERLRIDRRHPATGKRRAGTALRGSRASRAWRMRLGPSTIRAMSTGPFAKRNPARPFSSHTRSSVWRSPLGISSVSGTFSRQRMEQPHADAGLPKRRARRRGIHHRGVISLAERMSSAMRGATRESSAGCGDGRSVGRDVSLMQRRCASIPPTIWANIPEFVRCSELERCVATAVPKSSSGASARLQPRRFTASP